MAGMPETTKSASLSLWHCGGRRTCKLACRWTRSLVFRRSWNRKKPNGALSHELAQRSSRSGKHAPEISVGAAHRFHPHSIFYRRNVFNHQPGMVGLSQDLGQHFSVAGLAIADTCLVLRKASRRPYSIRIIADFADCIAIFSCASDTRRSLADRRRTACRQRRIDVDGRDPAYAWLAKISSMTGGHDMEKFPILNS